MADDPRPQGWDPQGWDPQGIGYQATQKPYAYLNGISANAGRPGDTSNLHPEFAGNMARAIQQARAAGLNVGLESAYRTPTQLIGQKNPNASFDAAGNSLHSYGLAADVNGIGPAGSKSAKLWAQIAQQNGLYNPYSANGSEYNHWQAVPFSLDNNSDAKAALMKASQSGNFNNVWTAANAYMPGAGGSNAPSRYASNMSATTANPGDGFVLPGTTVNTTGPARPGSGFISSLLSAESGGKNIANTHKGTSSGQAQGYAQITTGTWKDFAPQAGVDLNQYPTPMTDKDGNPVPYDVQMKVASIIPMGRWAPETLNKLTAQGFKIDTSKTLAENAALNGTSIPSAPAVASGTTGTAAGAPPAGAGPFGGFKTQADADAFQKNLSNLDKTMGGKGLGQGQQDGGQSGPPDVQASQMIGPPPQAMNVSPLLAMTPMTYGQTINSLQDPATWYAPPGGRPQPRPQQGPIGTSLNSLDPSMTPFPQSPISGMGYMGLGYSYPGGGMPYG